MRPLPSDQDHTGRSFGPEELAALEEALGSGTLFAPKGTFVGSLEEAFGRLLDSAGVVACSSGTAAVHAAISAIDPEPGDEVITSGVTDMGAITPILYQGAIPVFADIDPSSGNVTAETLEGRISERTTAIVVTHLFGNPCDMGPILELAQRHELPVIEDCAQAYLARVAGRVVGTLGTIACFSLQQGKHITSGEGGLVATSDPILAHRMRLFVNKAWDYESPSDHDFLALNYRMTELQGAVALAQLARLEDGVDLRRANARRLDTCIADLPGLEPLSAPDEGDPSYWRYGLLVDRDVIPGGPEAVAAELQALGIPSSPRYIAKPAFRCGLFANQQTFGESRWPFSIARDGAIDYDDSLFPGTFSFLDNVLVLPWNERYVAEDVDRLCVAIRDAAKTVSEDVS